MNKIIIKYLLKILNRKRIIMENQPKEKMPALIFINNGIQQDERGLYKYVRTSDWSIKEYVVDFYPIKYWDDLN